MTTNPVEDNHEVEVLGNIMFNVPRSTFFMARINGTWCGKLIDEAGPHSTASAPASEIRQNTFMAKDSLCLVFKNQTMLDQFVKERAGEHFLLQEFVREAIRYGRTPVVLLLDELSELFETNLDEHIVEGEDWCRLMHRVNLPHKSDALLSLIGFAGPSLWDFRDWCISENYCFRFARMLVELHAQFLLLTGREQNRIQGSPVSYDTQHNVCFVQGEQLAEPDSMRLMMLDKQDGSRPTLMHPDTSYDLTTTTTETDRAGTRQGMLYQPQVFTMLPRRDLPYGRAEYLRKMPLDVQTAVTGPPKAQQESSPSETKVPHG